MMSAELWAITTQGIMYNQLGATPLLVSGTDLRTDVEVFRRNNLIYLAWYYYPKRSLNLDVLSDVINEYPDVEFKITTSHRVSVQLDDIDPDTELPFLPNLWLIALEKSVSAK